MEKIYGWLFGENKWAQKKKLKKLFIITAIMAILIIIELFDNQALAQIFAVITALIWGWGVASAAAAKAAGILEVFGSDVAIFFMTIVLWIFLGVAAGAVSFVLGVIRFVQLLNE